MKKGLFIASLCLMGSSVNALAESMISPSPADAKVYLISPAEGETVTQTFKVQFGLSGMGVAPSGVKRDKTGHHHLLIDSKALPDLSKPLPSTVKHFGGGQTETMLTLSPGQHTLQLVLGNFAHIPHDKPLVSNKISITVK